MDCQDLIGGAISESHHNLGGWDRFPNFTKMGRYVKGNLVIPEADPGRPLSHFSWFYPGCTQSGKPFLNQSQGSKMNQTTGLAVSPLRSVAPTTEPSKTIDLKTKHTKANKQKSKVKVSDQLAPKVVRPKQSKTSQRKTKTKEPSIPEVKRERRDLNVDSDKGDFDFSILPSPYCSCTGFARMCYKWGTGGWQSSCCTPNISEYPLPMSCTRPGVRMAGRKMSNGAYGKLLVRLASEGHDLNHAIDLKTHWSRHGTNKFVTIK